MYESFKTIENNRRKYIITCIEKIKVERQAELEDIMSMYNRYYEKIEEMNKIEEQKNIVIEETKEDASNEANEPVEKTTLIETNDTPIINLKRNETKIETGSETKYKTNISYSQSLITKYISSQCLESNDKIDNNVRGLINKRITQISKDADHISEIAKELKKYTQNKQCIIQINKKIIEKGKLQVSIYKESYKSYSYFLSQIYNAELLADLRARILTTEMNENRHFTGVYLIYFGFLKLEKMFEEAWFVLASMLNVEPSGGSLYVLEAFISVLGCNMYNFYGSEFSKIRDYLQLEHFSNVDNDPVKSRIGSLIEKIMK